MDNILYDRKYRIIANGIDVSDLHCEFYIERSLTETPAYSELTIFNLNSDTEAQIFEPNGRVIIEAGYHNSENYGLLIDADVVQVLSYWEDGVDKKTILVMQDADPFLNNNFISTSLEKGQTLSTITNELITTGTNPAEVGFITPDLADTSLPRGKVMFGLSKDYLRQIQIGQGAALYVENNKVNIVKAPDPPQGEIISLSSRSGLIGSAEMTADGISAKCLLQAQLRLNGLVHIDNSFVRQQKMTRDGQIGQLDADGVYRIIKLSYTGQLRGPEWTTSFTAITQSGSTPDLGDSLR